MNIARQAAWQDRQQEQSCLESFFQAGLQIIFPHKRTGPKTFPQKELCTAKTEQHVLPLLRVVDTFRDMRQTVCFYPGSAWWRGALSYGGEPWRPRVTAASISGAEWTSRPRRASLTPLQVLSADAQRMALKGGTAEAPRPASLWRNKWAKHRSLCSLKENIPLQWSEKSCSQAKPQTNPAAQ